MNTKQILEEAKRHAAFIAFLKKKAPFYPEIFNITAKDTYGYTYVATTKVKFIFRGVEYSRHHVEFIKGEEDIKNKLESRLHEKVKLTLSNAVPGPYDDIIRFIE